MHTPPRTVRPCGSRAVFRYRRYPPDQPALAELGTPSQHGVSVLEMLELHRTNGRQVCTCGPKGHTHGEGQRYHYTHRQGGRDAWLSGGKNAVRSQGPADMMDVVRVGMTARRWQESCPLVFSAPAQYLIIRWRPLVPQSCEQLS